VLAGNPVPGAGDQIEVPAALVFKDLLNWCILRWIVLDGGYAETPRFPLPIDDHDFISYMQVAQTPEDGGIPSWPVEMAVNYGTSQFSRKCT
jgi:hypothetical protein